MSLKFHKTPEQLAAADAIAKIRAQKLSRRKSRIITERHRQIFDAYRAYCEAHPEYQDRGICRWRNERWELEHPAVTRSIVIRQQFIAIDPERNRPISRAMTDEELAEGMLRYIRLKEWHGEADLITLGFWLSLMENTDIRKMDAELLTAWLGSTLGKKARSQYETSDFKEVEI